MINLTKYIYFFALIFLFQLFTFNTASSIRKYAKPNKESIKYVLQTIVPIFKIYEYLHGIYLCNGVLIHPRAVLSSKACVRDFSALSYAIGLYKWENDQATINRTQLYNVQYFLNSYIFFGYLKKDNSTTSKQIENYEYVNINTPIILVLQNRINSMTPADLTHSLTSEDMYSNNIIKNCYRLKISPDLSKTNLSIDSAITYQLISDNIVLNLSEIQNIYHKFIYNKYKDDIKNNKNITLRYVNDSSIFVTNTHKITHNEILESSGSPLICQRSGKGYYELTGILIDTLNDFPIYYALNEGWIFQKLFFLNSLKTYTLQVFEYINLIHEPEMN